MLLARFLVAHSPLWFVSCSLASSASATLIAIADSASACIRATFAAARGERCSSFKSRHTTNKLIYNQSCAYQVELPYVRYLYLDIDHLDLFRLVRIFAAKRQRLSTTIHMIVETLSIILLWHNQPTSYLMTECSASSLMHLPCSELYKPAAGAYLRVRYAHIRRPKNQLPAQVPC